MMMPGDDIPYFPEFPNVVHNLSDWPMAAPGQSVSYSPPVKPLPRPTGWHLIVGQDTNGDDVAVLADLILPPGRLRRWIVRIVLGWTWKHLPLERR